MTESMSQPAPGHGPMAAGLRLLLLVAYPVLSHIASLREEGLWAVLALGSLVVWALLVPLAQRRLWAVAVLALSALALSALVGSPVAWLSLLAAPVVFPLLVAWGFARTLLPGKVPLIARIVRALYARAGRSTTAALERYARQLTAAWAAVLVLLAGLNLGLAASAVPGGVPEALGYQPWWPVTHEQWSWCANLINWGLLGGFSVVEYWIRQRRFPDPPYANVVDFGRQLGQLGPAFWKDLLR